MKRTLILPAMLTVSVVAASANSVSYYVDVFGNCGNQTGICSAPPALASTTPIALNSVNLEPGGISNTIKVPNFNTSIGTLQSVSLLLDWTFTGDVDVLNSDDAHHDSSAGIHGFTNASASIPLTISGSLLPTINATVAIAGINSPVGQVAAPTENFTQLMSWNSYYSFIEPTATSPANGCALYGGTYSSANGGTCTVATTPATYTPGEYTSPQTTQSCTTNLPNNCTSLTLNSGFGAFEAAGYQPFTYNVGASAATYGGSENGQTHFLHFGGSGNGGAVLEVTYNYTPLATPEPASMLMVGILLLGGGAGWRRWNNKNR